MSGAPPVQLGDEVRRRADAKPVRLALQRVHAEILVDLPVPPALPIRGSGKQSGAVIAESQRGKPPLGDQPIELGDRRFTALEDDRMRSALVQMQPVHTALERRELERRFVHARFAHDRLQRVKKLGHTRFLASLESRAEQVDADRRTHTIPVARACRLAGPARADSSTRPTTRRASKCSSASARAERQWRS